MSRRRKQKVKQNSDTVETSPGAVLRVARESAGFSQHDAADALNLTHTVIQHLEGDVYDELPGLAFSIGYLRAYAKFLDLDADAIVEDVKKITQSASDSALVAHVVPVLDKVDEAEESSGLLPGLLLVAGVVVMGVLMWWIFFATDDDLVQPTAEDTQAVPELLKPIQQKPLQPPETTTRSQSQPEPRSVADAIQSNTPSQAVSFEKTQSNSPDETDIIQQLTAAQNSSAPDDAPVIEAVSVAVSQEASESPVSIVKPSVFENGARRITAEGDQLLEFNFSSDSWVGVKNSEMEDLYGNLNRAGSSLKLIGQGPFRVLIGYAPGATLSVDGTPVDLVSRTRNNVARVTVGQ